MRKIIPLTLAALLLALGIGGPAHAQSVDALIARHLAAKGGLDKLKAVSTMRITARGTIPSINLEFPVIVATKRPNLFYQESAVGGQKVIAGFDGTRAWLVNPILGIAKPVDVQGAQLEAMKRQADYDGPLVDSKAKGITVDYAGSETLDGKKVEHLKLTTANGQVQHLYLDADTALEVKSVVELKTDDRVTTMESVYSNYQPVDGLMMAHTIQQKVNGQVLQLAIEKVELSPALDDALFKAPEAPAPAAATPAPKNQ